MKIRDYSNRSVEAGFSLLELIIVLLIVALVLGSVYALANGTLELAGNVRRAQRRDSREQAFVAFGEHLFGSLPAGAALNLKTVEEAGNYLSSLELHGVPSPFSGYPGHIVTIFTEAVPGGGSRLVLSAHPAGGDRGLRSPAEPHISTVLFDDLTSCEWRIYDPLSRQWATFWTEKVGANAARTHPLFVELLTTGAEGIRSSRVFWVVPNQAPRPVSPFPADGGNKESPPALRD